MKNSLLLSILLCFGFQVAMSQIKTDSLVYHYSFDGSGNDLSGNNYNATPNNQQYIFDRVGLDPSSAISLNGTNAYVQLPNNPNLKPSFPFALSFWVKIGSIPAANQSIYRADDDTTAYAGFSVVLTKFGRINAVIGSGNGIGSQHRKTFLSSTILTINKWHHLVVNYISASSAEIYLDGVQETIVTNGTATSMGYSTVSGILGRNPVSSGGFNYLDVSLDEMRLYNDKIEQSEVGYLAFEYPCIKPYADTIVVNDSVINTVQVMDTIVYYDTTFIYNNVAYYDSVVVSDTLLISSASGTPPSQSFEINIYPNPNKDRLYFNFGASFVNLSGKSMRILNNFGVAVYTKPISNPFEYVDLVALGGKGSYFIQMIQGNNNVLLTRKLIVQ